MPMTPNGVANAQNSINSIFSALMKAPLLEQQAEMEAGLRSAQTYNAHQTGRLNEAKAGQEQLTLDSRQHILGGGKPAIDLPVFMQQALYSGALGGDFDPAKLSTASGNLQKQGAIADIQGGSDPLKTSQAYFAVSGNAPFDEVGTTGYSLNKLTGGQIEGNRILADAFGQKNRSEVNENNAQAYSASQSGNLSKARIGHLGTGGGSQAALQRARANVVNDVFEDMSILPEEREAEVERRMALVQLPTTPANSAAPAPSAGSMKPLPKGIPAGSVLIGTSGGKPVYQAPNGKRFIED